MGVRLEIVDDAGRKAKLTESETRLVHDAEEALEDIKPLIATAIAKLAGVCGESLSVLRISEWLERQVATLRKHQKSLK